MFVDGKPRLVAWVRDLGSTNGAAVYGQDGTYILYTGRADAKGPVAGIPPKSYGIRTLNEVRGFIGKLRIELPHAAPAPKQAPTSVKI